MALFSGSRGRKAAIAISSYLNNQRDQADALIGEGLAQTLSALRGGLDEAAGTIGRGGDDLARGFAESRDHLAGLRGVYQPLYDLGLGAIRTYGDAVGAGGAEGNARALASFRAGPGYAFARDQGLDAINRTASARGLLASGNTTADLLRYATGLADQTYGNYVARLQPLLGLAQSGASGIGQGMTGLAQNAAREGEARAALGNVLAGLQYGAGREAAGLTDRSVQNRANLLLAIANQVAGALGQGFAAGDRADASRLDAITSGLGLGTRLLGSLFGSGSGSRGSLTSLFGPSGPRF